MESSEPLLTSRRDDKPYGASKSVADSTKFQAEIELSDARKKVRDLALKIEESNSRTKSMQQKQHKTLKWHEEQEHEVYLKNEDYQYAQVMEEIKRIKHELIDLKFDMKRVLEGKKQAENTFKASSSKKSTLTSAIERIQKEIEEIDEEHVLVELARIEAVKEQEAIEAHRKKEAHRYQTQLEEVKKKVKEVDQHNELTQKLELTLYNMYLLEKELAQAKETIEGPDLLHTITEDLETAKIELANIKTEEFNFKTSIDVIKNELKLVIEERAHLEKEEEKQELTIQTLNSKILKGKAKLESVSTATEKANAIASNLSLTVEQLRAETETAKRERKLISEEIEKIQLEIPKTESEIELTEKRLEAAMEELKTTKASEFIALENLKNMIDSTIQSRELTSLSRSTIKITKFEYDYLTGKAGGAEEIADKKVAAAQAWVEAVKANENEILVKIKMAKQEIKESHVLGDDGEDASGLDTRGRRRTVDGELNRWGQNGDKVSASRRMSMYKIGDMTPGKRARSQRFSSSAARHTIKSASFSRRREKVPQSLAKLLNGNNDMGE
ncbi:hypothetical protein R6Q59_034586 [Mikania micrantha]